MTDDLARQDTETENEPAVITQKAWDELWKMTVCLHNTVCHKDATVPDSEETSERT